MGTCCRPASGLAADDQLVEMGRAAGAMTTGVCACGRSVRAACGPTTSCRSGDGAVYERLPGRVRGQDDSGGSSRVRTYETGRRPQPGAAACRPSIHPRRATGRLPQAEEETRVGAGTGG